MKEDNEDEIKYLSENGIENIVIDSTEGKISIAELLLNYAIDWHIKNDQGEWGRQS